MNEIFDEVKATTYKPPTTNADRIRAMTDEELAEFICSHSTCNVCKWSGWVCGLRDWLKQPCGGADQ